MKIYGFIVIVLCLSVASEAASEDSALREGNKAFSSGDYDYALQSYSEALEVRPDSYKAHFNLGTAHYMKGDFANAEKAFNQALMTDDAVLESQATYNIANCKYRQGGLKENTDLNAALSLYRDAMSHYKRAIDLNPKDEQSKFNHEFVEKKIKSVLDQIKQQQEQQSSQQNCEGQEQESSQQQQGQSSQGQANQKQDGSESQGESGSDSEQKQQQSQAAQARENGSEDGEEKSASSEEKEDGSEENEGFQVKEDTSGGESDQTQQTQSQSEDRMTEEEARMLLDSYRQREESQPNMNRGRQSSGYNRIAKNW